MHEELCERLREMWGGEGGPAKEAAEVIERQEARLMELESRLMYAPSHYTPIMPTG